MNLQDKLKYLQRTVDYQANDAGLWFDANYSSEAYLQSALRFLHELIEELREDV